MGPLHNSLAHDEAEAYLTRARAAIPKLDPDSNCQSAGGRSQLCGTARFVLPSLESLSGNVGLGTGTNASNPQFWGGLECLSHPTHPPSHHPVGAGAGSKCCGLGHRTSIRQRVSNSLSLGPSKDETEIVFVLWSHEGIVVSEPSMDIPPNNLSKRAHFNALTLTQTAGLKVHRRMGDTRRSGIT